MNFSLVIPTHNRKANLELCLQAACQQDYSDYEVIVVDDASTDGTQTMIAQSFPRIHYHRQAVNRGPAAARNQGIRLAAGRIIVFTDDDCVLPINFLTELAAGYQQYPQAAGVGGYLAAADDVLAHNIFAQYEAYVTHQVYHAGSEPYLGGFECPAGGTNSMSYRVEVLNEAGCFDESFPFAAGEDADLKLRIVNAGHQLLYLPLRVTHLRPYSWRNFRGQFRTRGHGVVHFEQKHYGRAPSITRLILRGGIRTLRWAKDLFRIGPKLATVKFMAELLDLQGQWQAVRNR
jgi:glycosyltransferase involved in cell wall biosynthesis